MRKVVAALAALAAIVLVVAAVVLSQGPSGAKGGVRAEYKVVPADGKAPSAQVLADIRAIVERRAIAADPEDERRELAALYRGRGIEPALADELSVKMMRDPELALETHARCNLHNGADARRRTAYAVPLRRPARCRRPQPPLEVRFVAVARSPLVTREDRRA